MKTNSGSPVETGPAPLFSRPFHVVAKPVGAACNLSCQYCYYLEKEALHPAGGPARMDEAVLERFVADYIALAPAGGEVVFSWQGGEPTLAGVAFYERVVELQRRHAAGRRVTNALQTNGTLLDDAWGELLRREGFRVSVSLDGPAELHDTYRRDRGGQPTHARTMAGIETLRRHGVDFDTVTVVNRANAEKPLAVYRFLRETGSRQLNFVPLVERTAGPAEKSLHLKLAAPPKATDPRNDRDHMLTLWSVRPAQFGEFLCLVFDEWVRRDVGRIAVRLFDSTLTQWMGGEATECAHAAECGRGVALEHDGSVYACDHYVYPEYRLGNVRDAGLAPLLDSVRLEGFSLAKTGMLPRQCRECPVCFACQGGCPKHRFMHTADGEAGLNYLCQAYKQFFHYVDAAMVTMGGLMQSGRPAADIVRLPRSRWQRGRL